MLLIRKVSFFFYVGMYQFFLKKSLKDYIHLLQIKLSLISRSCVSFTSMRVDIFSWNLYIFPIIPFELIFRELSVMIMLRVDKISLQ